MKSLGFAIALGLLLAPVAQAQVTGVVTDTHASIQLTPFINVPYPKGVVPIPPGTNVGGAYSDGPSHSTFYTTSQLNPDNIEFKNGNVAGGFFSQASTSSSIDITFTNDGPTAVLPKLKSTILPAGFGMYLADLKPACASDVSFCGETTTSATLAGLRPGIQSLSPLFASATFDFSILSDDAVVYSLSGLMTLAYDPVAHTSKITTDYSGPAAALDGFTVVSSPAAFGVSWKATPILITLGADASDLLAPGDSRTLSYVTNVTSFSSHGCIGTVCLIAYSAFGDPVGRGGDAEFESLGMSAFGDTAAFATGPGPITDVHFQPFFFDLPTFSGGVVSFGLKGAAVPEPATWALMVMAMGALGAMLRRRRAILAA